MDELFQAIDDYIDGLITMDLLFAVIDAYYSGKNVNLASGDLILIYDQNENGTIEENEIRTAAQDCLDKKLSLDDFVVLFMYYAELSEPEQIPKPQNIYSLSPNYPNPFNPETTINFSLQETGDVNLNVYNVKGQLVKTLVDQKKDAGNHSVVWAGKDNNNRKVATGVYFYRIKAGEFTDMKKMLLIK